MTRRMSRPELSRGPAPSIRKLAFLTIACIPLAVQAACAAKGSELIFAQAREAGALEVPGRSGAGEGDDDEDGSVSPRDAGKDGMVGGGKDARVDADAGTPAIVVINEIYVDIDGFGDGAEFVELRAEPGTPIGDLKLRLLGSNGTVEYEVPVADAGTEVGASGFWVVGGAQTFKLGVQDRVDQIVPLGNWGLEATRGAVQLVRGTELLDVVAWSEDPDSGAIPAPSSPPTATGEGSPANVPTITKTTGNPAHSFGRRAAEADTNDNGADFCSMAASPGYPQQACD